MARPRAEPTVRHSVLDRLIGGGEPAEGPAALAESARAFRLAVLRDLEWLLNTRRIAEPAPEVYPELQRSVYHYGLPDLSSLSLDSRTVRQRLVGYVEECIALFEPRLSSVRVTPVELKSDDRTVRFTVEALLRMEPDPERIVFDTLLEPTSGEFEVTGDERA